ncbi:MAG: Asp-tRNA(Asn)/Glu-tRNA(Gln) amidotransferase subunit GatC [Myxococcales bacterium]|nr:Asp-tRNA(Asn)/Glu-tRNA(Gln) amidotransferase subunit GatC [Myxococcales bacterium]
MRLTLEQVRHVAGLARLKLGPEEEQRYQQQLSAILEAMEKLRELDTESVEPTSHSTLSGFLWREDLSRQSLEVEKALANAPEKVGTAFSVPKIIE